MKICSHCKKEKDYSEFHKNKKAKDGYHDACKTCRSIYERRIYIKTIEQKRKYYQEHKEEILEQCKERYKKRDREYYKQNKEKIRNGQRKLELIRKYNISIDEYNILYNKQDGCCMICKLKIKLLYVDHDHNNNKVRGLLCQKCNSGLGFFNDNISLLKNAVKYLEEERTIPHDNA